MKAKQFFGEFFKEMRIKGNFTLREFCNKFGYDPGNISKIERGLLKPPNSKEKLEKYALDLGLERGSDNWIEFIDRASACKGEIPEELLDNEAVLKKLPLIFRTFRNKRVTNKAIDELIEQIRRL